MKVPTKGELWNSLSKAGSEIRELKMENYQYAKRVKELEQKVSYNEGRVASLLEVVKTVIK